MTDSADAGGVSRCRLCAARAACGIITAAEFELKGFDRFSGDRDICDACIGVNYSWHWVWGTVEQWLSLTLGGVMALLVSLLMTLRVSPWKVLPHAPQSVRVLVLYVPCVVSVWLLVTVLDWLRRYRGRSELRKKLSENPALAAEEYYWLAVWGRLTGRERFSRRMLKRAMRLGAVDVRGLASKR